MSELDPLVVHHRSLDSSMAQVPYAYYEARTKVFRKNGVRTACTWRDKKLVPVLYREMKDRDFVKYATSWEVLNSKVPFGDGSGIAYPVVDQNYFIIGHRATFSWLQIFVDPGAKQDQLIRQNGTRRRPCASPTRGSRR